MQRKAPADTPSNAQQHATKKRGKAIKMAVAILMLFYLCVIPNTLVYFIPYWRPSCVIQRVLYFMTSFSLYLSSIVIPIICLSFVESYRRRLSNILCPCGRKLNGNVTRNVPGEINPMKMKTSRRESCRQSFKNTKAMTKPSILFYRDAVQYKTLRSEKCKCESTRANFGNKRRRKFRYTEG